MNLIYFALLGSLGLYILFVLFFLTGLRRLKQSKTIITQWPTVSIVIAARNEEANLPILFRDLTQIDYPMERLEIVVADDRSTDKTWSIINHFSKEHPQIKGMRIEEKSMAMTPKKYALTKAIESSSGENILSTDADCRIPPGWVKSMVAKLESGSGIVVGSSAINTFRHSSFIHYQLVDFLALISANAGANGWGFSWTGTGQNLAYKRKLFEEINGFNPVRTRISGDDIYLVQAISKDHKCTVNIDPESFIKTQPVKSIGQFLSQRIRWSSNSRLAIKTNLFFFLFLFNTFFLNTSIIAGVLTAELRSNIPMVFGIKFFCDALVLYSGALIFHISFPSITYIIWSFLQPIYIPFVGLLGLTGRFQWKP